MPAEHSYVRLGLFVVIGLGVMLATGLFFIQRVRSRDVIRLVTYTTENVSGLDVSSPVRYRGVSIGSISRVRVTPPLGRVAIDFQIFQDRLTTIGAKVDVVEHFTELTAFPKLRAQVVSNPITGEAYLLLDFPPNPPPPPELGFTPPPNYVPSIASSMSALQDRLPAVLERAEATFETLRDIIARVPAGLNRSEQFLNQIDRILRESELPALSASLRTFSTESTSQIAQMRADIEQLTGPESSLVKFADEARAALREADVPGSTRSAQAAAERATLAADDLRRSLPVIRETLDQLRELARHLDEQPESVIYGPRPQPQKSKSR